MSKKEVGKEFYLFNSMKINILIGIVFISFQLMSQPIVDGFNKGKGNLDIVGSYTYDSFSKYYASPGLIGLGRKTNVVSAFSAIGITDKWTLQSSLPFISSGNESGIQDLAIVSKIEFYKKTIGKGSLTFLVSNGFLTPLTDYQTESLFALGQQATAFDNRLVSQYFLNNGLFFMIQSGYTFRLNPVPSSIPIALKIGLAKEKNYFDLWVDYQKGGEGFSYRDGFNSKFREFSVSYIKIGATYYRAINKNFGLALNLSNTLSGENVGKSTTGSVAFIYKLKYKK